jgi:hypothetical protein
MIRFCQLPWRRKVGLAHGGRRRSFRLVRGNIRLPKFKRWAYLDEGEGILAVSLLFIPLLLLLHKATTPLQHPVNLLNTGAPLLVFGMQLLPLGRHGGTQSRVRPDDSVSLLWLRLYPQYRLVSLTLRWAGLSSGSSLLAPLSNSSSLSWSSSPPFGHFRLLCEEFRLPPVAEDGPDAFVGSRFKPELPRASGAVYRVQAGERYGCRWLNPDR